jgi:hypothetical protein
MKENNYKYLLNKKIKYYNLNINNFKELKLIILID